MPLCLPSSLTLLYLQAVKRAGGTETTYFSWIQFESCQIKKARDTIFHHPHSAQTLQLAAMGGACEGLG